MIKLTWIAAAAVGILGCNEDLVRYDQPFDLTDGGVDAGSESSNAPDAQPDPANGPATEETPTPDLGGEDEPAPMTTCSDEITPEIACEDAWELATQCEANEGCLDCFAEVPEPAYGVVRLLIDTAEQADCPRPSVECLGTRAFRIRDFCFEVEGGGEDEDGAEEE